MVNLSNLDYSALVFDRDRLSAERACLLEALLRISELVCVESVSNVEILRVARSAIAYVTPREALT